MFGSSGGGQVSPTRTKDWSLTHYNGNIYDPKPDDEAAEALANAWKKEKKPDQYREHPLGLSSGVTSHSDTNNTTQSGLTINT